MSSISWETGFWKSTTIKLTFFSALKLFFPESFVKINTFYKSFPLTSLCTWAQLFSPDETQATKSVIIKQNSALYIKFLIGIFKYSNA